MIIYLVLFSLLSVLLYLLSLLLSFIPRNLLSQKCWVKANSFIIFLLEACMKTHFIFFVFFRLLFFKGTCFKFYLIAVLICYLYFIINHEAHNILGTLWWMSFLTRFDAGGLEIGKKCGLGFSRNIMLSEMLCWDASNFQGVLYY